MKAREVTAGLVESNGSLQLGGWLKVTYGLTACTPGSAPGQMLGNEYGRTLPFYRCVLLCNEVLPNTFGDSMRLIYLAHSAY